MCIGRELRRPNNPLRLPAPWSRRADDAKDGGEEWWMEEDAISRGRVTGGGSEVGRSGWQRPAIATDGVRL
jgi:hypothetical protein